MNDRHEILLHRDRQPRRSDRRELLIEKCCPACDTVLHFHFAVWDSGDLVGTISHTADTTVTCPECGTPTPVASCVETAHMWAEVVSQAGQVTETVVMICLVCGSHPHRPLTGGATEAGLAALRREASV